MLAETGISGVTIDALSRRLGLTKGSFYHHFKGLHGYRADLLQHFEKRESQAFIDLVEALPVDDGAGKLRALIEAAVADEASVNLEPRVRIWASHDDLARACIERVDAQRVEYLRRQCRAITDSELADQTGTMIYLVGIGSGHIVPPLPVGEQVRLCERLISDLEATGTASRSDGTEGSNS
ncbi:TetR/AcrR family transcriptional regulator [Myceligenerans crystallogenes]|uniref:TetR/AcrR family transcriptional regulator n=2 Tax=Myceligenerans crystallogenes TaxID=316335 RepID=A0ABP4ZTJ9_9MICO